MREKLRTIRDWWIGENQFSDMVLSFDGIHPTRVYVWRESIVRNIELFASSLVCRVRGHDLEDEGYASPERGCIRMTCARCGYQYPTHWLY